MPNASDLKNLAAQVKRTNTALRNLASHLGLGREDQKALLNAATVLATHSRKVSIEANQAKRVKEAKAKALDKATRDARALMAEWPTMASTMEKVALCLMMRYDDNLRADMQDKYRLESSLKCWTELALSDLPEHVAFLAVREGRSVAEVMAAMREKYEQVLARPGTAAFALRWQIIDARVTSPGQVPPQGQETGSPRHG